jgi:hypothetical protein
VLEKFAKALPPLMDQVHSGRSERKKVGLAFHTACMRQLPSSGTSVKTARQRTPVSAS